MGFSAPFSLLLWAARAYSASKELLLWAARVQYNFCYGKDHGEPRQALEHVGRGEEGAVGVTGERHLLFKCCYGTGIMENGRRH